jgi:hypothetical protein
MIFLFVIISTLCIHIVSSCCTLPEKTFTLRPFSKNVIRRILTDTDSSYHRNFCRISLYANETNLMINLILVLVLIVPMLSYRIIWNLNSPINLRMECTRAEYRMVWRCWTIYQSTFSLTEDNYNIYKLHKNITVKKEHKLWTEAHGLVVINRYMLKIVIWKKACSRSECIVF